jgi:hypothetical protein
VDGISHAPDHNKFGGRFKHAEAAFPGRADSLPENLFGSVSDVLPFRTIKATIAL